MLESLSVSVLQQKIFGSFYLHIKHFKMTAVNEISNFSL